MMKIFWDLMLAGLLCILVVMLILLLSRKNPFEKLNFIFSMNTVMVLLILTAGFTDGRIDMYIDIALSYSVLGFVTSVILARYIGGRRK